MTEFSLVAKGWELHVIKEYQAILGKVISQDQFENCDAAIRRCDAVFGKLPMESVTREHIEMALSGIGNNEVKYGTKSGYLAP